MAKTYRGSPLFHMRMPAGLYDWFKDYSVRTGKPMSAILKEYLQELRRFDERAQRSNHDREKNDGDLGRIG